MNANINKDLWHLIRPIESVALDPQNARSHAKRSLDAIALSLQKYGQQKPIVALNGVLVAGNGTWEAARQLGWTEIAIAEFKGSKKEAKAYAIADNRTAELSEWNFGRLADQLGLFENQLELGVLWSPNELAILAPSQAGQIGITPDDKKRIFDANTIKQIVIYLEDSQYKDILLRLKRIADECKLESNTDVIIKLLEAYEQSACKA